jgi:hypothetical protein
MTTTKTIAEQGEHARHLARLAALRHKAHEAQMAVEHMLLDFQRERITAELDAKAQAKAEIDPLQAYIQALEAKNAAWRAALEPEMPEVQEKQALGATPGKTAENIGDHVAYAYAQYALKLERYAKANDIKAKRCADAIPSPKPSQFVLQRDLRGGVGVLAKVLTSPCIGCNTPTAISVPYWGEPTPMCPTCQETLLGGAL